MHAHTERGRAQVARRNGWRLVWSPLERGRGYRAYDFPWHAMSKYAPRWRTRAWLSYIPGFTLTVGTYGREIHSRRLKRWYFQVTTKGNNRRDTVPQWW